MNLLKEKQTYFENMIREHAIKIGLTTEQAEPITDGVCNIEEYIKSSPK